MSEYRINVRFNLSDTEHLKIIDYLNSLDKEKYKSRNQFIIDALKTVIANTDKHTADNELLEKFREILKEELTNISVNRQGKTCGQVGHKSRDIISETDSGRQVQRYIRLTYLIPELLDMMDEGKIAFSVGVELSFLDEQSQYDLLRVIEEQEHTPSYSQAWHMHKDYNAGILTAESIENTLTAEKPNQKEMFRLPLEQVQKFCPKADKKQLEDYVVKACEYYNKHLQRQRSRDAR